MLLLAPQHSLMATVFWRCGNAVAWLFKQLLAFCFGHDAVACCWQLLHVECCCHSDAHVCPVFHMMPLPCCCLSGCYQCMLCLFFKPVDNDSPGSGTWYPPAVDYTIKAKHLYTIYAMSDKRLRRWSYIA